MSLPCFPGDEPRTAAWISKREGRDLLGEGGVRLQKFSQLAALLLDVPALLDAILKTSSAVALSRSAWRVWASRISGAAYAAWVEKARLSRMNG